ncbi:MAG TPA: NAD(P)H-hydrate epimerase, partial [Firmicutes bacterium]|nr:NAD(P)H-hydrate epimerase [Bacillota bacterium]
MRVVTGSEMRSLEKKAFESLGLSSLVVMENAGSRIVEVLKGEFGPLEGKRIYILAGQGNNGGDGLVAARQLLALGARVKVFLVGDGKRSTRENGANLAILHKLGADVAAVDFKQLNKLRFNLNFADLIVDALLGTGFSGQLAEEWVSLITLVNETQCPVVAIDCPTG